MDLPFLEQEPQTQVHHPPTPWLCHLLPCCLIQFRGLAGPALHITHAAA